MREQEWYEDLLKKVITETENQRINTSEEMIQTLVDEISLSKLNHGMPTEAESLSE